MDRECNILAECEPKVISIKHKITEENLVKISNKGIYKRGLKDADNVGKAEISGNDEFIKVNFDDIEVNIKEDFSEFNCSCQSKTVCRHVITALIIISECNVDAEIETVIENEIEETVQEEIIDNEVEESVIITPNIEYLDEVMQFVSLIFDKGFINCNESDIDVANQLAVKGENTLHNNISLMLRTISSDIDKMLKKSTEFVMIDAFHVLTRIYNTSRAILNNKDSYEHLKVLCTDMDSGYKERGTLNFIGLGAYPWSSKSGYTGITAILYCDEDKEIYTYSSSIAYIHEKTKNFDDIDNLTKSFHRREHWQSLYSMSMIAGSTFKLVNCKTNSLKRISSSKNTYVNVPVATYIGTVIGNITDIELSSEKVIDNNNEYDYFVEKQSEKICIIYADRFEEINYNKALQILEFCLSDGENYYPCEIVWSNQNKNAVAYIETLARKGIEKGKNFVCRYIKNVFVPISIIDDRGTKSFYFD